MGPPADLLTIDLSSLYPELKGKRLRGRVQGNRVIPYYNRAGARGSASLRGREIVWVDDALDAFLLQVQGSGRVQLPNGDVIRLQYADQNGYPYQSIGRYLVDKGELTVEQATMPGSGSGSTSNPARLNEVLDSNPSFVFFSEEKLEDPSEGPKGAQGVPLTRGRSIAVDPASVPLGAPVFLDTTYPGDGPGRYSDWLSRRTRAARFAAPCGRISSGGSAMRQEIRRGACGSRCACGCSGRRRECCPAEPSIAGRLEKRR